MPCDTYSDRINLITFDEVLREISSAATVMNIDHIICGGDFNTDLSRLDSLHTISLLSIVHNEHLTLLDSLSLFDVSYTYGSKINHCCSLLDHVNYTHGSKINHCCSLLDHVSYTHEHKMNHCCSLLDHVNYTYGSKINHCCSLLDHVSYTHERKINHCCSLLDHVSYTHGSKINHCCSLLDHVSYTHGSKMNHCCSLLDHVSYTHGSKINHCCSLLDHVSYTHGSKINHCCSLLDHFMVSNNLGMCIENVYAGVSVDNMSDHIPLSVQFKITMQHTTIESVTIDEKMLWASADQSNIMGTC